MHENFCGGCYYEILNLLEKSGSKILPMNICTRETKLQFCTF